MDGLRRFALHPALLLAFLGASFVGCNLLASKKGGGAHRPVCQNQGDYMGAVRPYHTIPIDTINDFAEPETFQLGAAGGASNAPPSGYRIYVAWDECKLYFGIRIPPSDAMGPGRSAYRYFVLYIDTDPLGQRGTQNAKNFGSQDWELPFQADYLITVRTDGEVVQRGDSVVYDGNVQVYRWLERTLPTVERTWEELDTAALRIAGNTPPVSEDSAHWQRRNDSTALAEQRLADSVAAAQQWLADSIRWEQQRLADSIRREQQRLADSIAAAYRRLAENLTPARQPPHTGATPGKPEAPESVTVAGQQAPDSVTPQAPSDSTVRTRRRHTDSTAAARQRSRSVPAAVRRQHAPPTRGGRSEGGRPSRSTFLEFSIDLPTIGSPCAIQVLGWVLNTERDTVYAYWPSTTDPDPQPGLRERADSATAARARADSLAAAQQRRADSIAAAQQRRADSLAAAQQRRADSLAAAQQRLADSIAAAQGLLPESPEAAQRRRADSLAAALRHRADSLAAAQRRIADSLNTLLRRRADSLAAALQRRADSAAARRHADSTASAQQQNADSAVSKRTRLRHYYGFELLDGVTPTDRKNLDRIAYPHVGECAEGDGKGQ